jgi:hypothetical protein
VVDLIIYAIPACVLLLALELLSFKYARDEELVGYEVRDTRTSLATERPRYGLTKNIRTFRPTGVAFHEFVDLARDVRGASGWRERLGYLFRGPGWSPDGSGGGTRG